MRVASKEKKAFERRNPSKESYDRLIRRAARIGVPAAVARIVLHDHPFKKALARTSREIVVQENQYSVIMDLFEPIFTSLNAHRGRQLDFPNDDRADFNEIVLLAIDYAQAQELAEKFAGRIDESLPVQDVLRYGNDIVVMLENCELRNDAIWRKLHAGLDQHLCAMWSELTSSFKKKTHVPKRLRYCKISAEHCLSLAAAAIDRRDYHETAKQMQDAKIFLRSLRPHCEGIKLGAAA